MRHDAPHRYGDALSCAALDALCAARGAVDGHLTLVGAGRPVRQLLSVLDLEPAFGLTRSDQVGL